MVQKNIADIVNLSNDKILVRHSILKQFQIEQEEIWLLDNKPIIWILDSSTRKCEIIQIKYNDKEDKKMFLFSHDYYDLLFFSTKSIVFIDFGLNELVKLTHNYHEEYGIEIEIIHIDVVIETYFKCITKQTHHNANISLNINIYTIDSKNEFKINEQNTLINKEIEPIKEELNSCQLRLDLFFSISL